MTTTTITSSAATLGARIGSFIPMFSPVPTPDTSFFDEGPRQQNDKTLITTSTSGSMDTSAIDAYTQGVELTRQSRHDAGMAKIWSGEAGHVLLQNRFGMDKGVFPDRAYSDMDGFNAGTFIRSQRYADALWGDVLSFPIVIGDNDQSENFNLNGVIEPLSIRRPASFTSTDCPIEAHDIRATQGAGNVDAHGGSDQVLTVDYVEPHRAINGFIDMSDRNGSFFDDTLSTREPFADVRLVRNDVPPGEETTDMVRALSPMSGSTDNYVKHNQRSATCGWVYDGTAGVGTDSLAFGGMTY